mmetsp:Transcript_21363/g.31908  ORF Transcript_21363/g.31908 Transcript_21363/m.31908 type:complete len:208 (+) Transcript_21363:140-763(+)
MPMEEAPLLETAALIAMENSNILPPICPNHCLAIHFVLPVPSHAHPVSASVAADDVLHCSADERVPSLQAPHALAPFYSASPSIKPTIPSYCQHHHAQARNYWQYIPATTPHKSHQNHSIHSRKPQHKTSALPHPYSPIESTSSTRSIHYCLPPYFACSNRHLHLPALVFCCHHPTQAVPLVPAQCDTWSAVFHRDIPYDVEQGPGG